jgi:hypothetical protein
MVAYDTFKKMALSFPKAEEKEHFDLPSFRFKKKIFATYHIKDHRAMLKLSAVSQSVFCSYDSSIFFPVPGGWGTKGATYVDLAKVPLGIFKDALSTAYKEISS